MPKRSIEEMHQLGFLGLTPFVACAVAMWLSPWLLPVHIALDFHQLALVYGGLIVAYLSGVGAGAMLAPGVKSIRSFLPSQLATLAALIAIVPQGTFFIAIDAVWRHLILLLALIYLLLRDVNGARLGHLAGWYVDLRQRLTFFAAVSIALIAARLALWGYY